MKIIFDYQIFLFQKYGGISRYFYELSKNINRLGGHEARIIAGLYNNRYLQNDSFVSGLKNKGITAKIFYNRFFNKTEEACIFISKKLQSLHSCNIYHETYYHSKLTPPKKSILVTTIHDMIYEKFPDQFKNAAVLINDKKKSIEKAQHIIAVSEATKNDLINIYNVSPNKITVVHHGVSPFETSSTKTPKPALLKPFLLFVGRRDGYKNARLLLEAFSSDKELQKQYDLVFFGGSNETPEEAAFAKANQVTPFVYYLKGDDSLLEWLYLNARAFIYPSLYEGFGMPCLEAMQYNCPVIAASTPAIEEAAGNAALFFQGVDPTDLRVKINTLVSSLTTREKFINLGRERILHFTWKKTAENTIAAYAQCLND